MDTSDETPTIAEALQRITDLAERAKREEAARQVDMLEAQGALEAAETELLAVKAALRRDEQGADAVQALVLLGWPRDTGADPLEWAKGAVGTAGGFSFQNQVFAFERKLAALQEENASLKTDVHVDYIQQLRALLGANASESIVARVKSVVADNQRFKAVLDDTQQQRDGKQLIIDRVRAQLGAGKGESLQERVATFMADLAAAERTAGDGQTRAEAAEARVAALTAERDAARGDSLKLADMRLALDGLHDQLIEAGRKEMEHWATREREIEVFAEQTARLPWTGWSPPSIYPIEVYRAVVDRVIALQAAHDKVLQDDSGVVAAASASVERMQGELSDLRETLGNRAAALMAIGWNGSSDPLAWARTRERERALLMDALRILGWPGDSAWSPVAWAKQQQQGSRAHSWVGKVGNERCWRCHILRDSVAGTVDCPAMNKPEAAPVDG